MIIYPFAERKWEKALLFSVMTALLLLQRTTMYSLYLIGFYKATFLSFALMAMTGIAFLLKNRHDFLTIIKDSRLKLALASIVIFLFPMVVKQDWQLMYLNMLIVVLFCIMLSYGMSITELSRWFVVLMCVLGTYAMVATYGFRVLYDAKIWRPSRFKNAFGVKFINYGLAFVSIKFVDNRSFGIFREPGVHQFFLMTALYLNFYRADWQREWIRWTAGVVLVLCVLSTMATGGVIAMGLFAVILYLDKRYYRTRHGRILAAAVVAAFTAFAAVMIVYRPPIATDLYLMLHKLVAGEDSFVDRVGSLIVGLQIFLKHPLTGDKLSTVLYAIDNNTSSTMILFSGFGILTGVFHTVGWFCLVWDRSRKTIWNLALVLVLFMTFNTQNFITDVYFWLFPTVALSQRGISTWQVKKTHD